MLTCTPHLKSSPASPPPAPSWCRPMTRRGTTRRLPITSPRRGSAAPSTRTPDSSPSRSRATRPSPRTWPCSTRTKYLHLPSRARRRPDRARLKSSRWIRRIRAGLCPATASSRATGWWSPRSRLTTTRSPGRATRFVCSRTSSPPALSPGWSRSWSWARSPTARVSRWKFPRWCFR